MSRQLSRRTFLTASGLASASAFLTPNAIAQSSAGSSFGFSTGNSAFLGGLLPQRPRLTHGIASGDMNTDGAIIWARADKPARMIVETAATEDFANPKIFRASGLMTPESDLTGKLRLTGLESGQQIHYRVFLEDPLTGFRSEPSVGTFRTAPSGGRNIRFHWSGDVAGQGYGINPDLGGMFCWKTMADRNPDFFIHSGDTIYADGPIEETKTLKDGRVWKNITHDSKHKVAESLDEFRGQYNYNLTDHNYRAFNAQVPQLIQWDDHEVTNNWYPGEILDSDNYTEKNADVLAARAFQAFHEWQPLDTAQAVDGRVYRKVSYGPQLDIFVLDMRSYKDANPLNHKGTAADGMILGEKQLNWLVDALRTSSATWKVIASDLPIGIIVPDGESQQEGVANGTGGAPVGRESEIARLLSAIKEVKNIVWLTADVHYTAAHHYSPERAAFKDFMPFWEFVAGPLNAGAFGPNKMDSTFGPEVVFYHGAEYPDQSPLDECQHFGEVDINGENNELTVRLITTRGTELFTKTLSPAD
ncbi:alkaline phosphatase D family protein [Staphylococcus chromogenes]|nr:alkaline phosphatase D family protein [Staphylococcus chromogenes]